MTFNHKQMRKHPIRKEDLWYCDETNRPINHPLISGCQQNVASMPQSVPAILKVIHTKTSFPNLWWIGSVTKNRKGQC